MKAQLKRKALKLVANSKNQPLLFHYSSDGTPVLVATEAHAPGLGQRDLKRKGTTLYEFLLQRGILKTCTTNGVMLMEVLISDPLPLTKGKKAPNLFVA